MPTCSFKLFDSRPLQVTGTTIYNALKIGELEVEEGTDRPMEPPTIQRVDVVWNPFEDIKPRNMKPLPSEVVVGGEGDEGAQAGRKRKNLALLSFGDEAEEDEEAIAAAPLARVKSIHDAVDDDARLVKAGTSAEAELRAKEEEAWERERAAREVRAKLAGPARGAAATEGGDADPEGEETFEAVMRKRIMDKRRELGHTERAVLPPGADAPEDDARRAEKEARRQEKEARKKEKEEREASRRAREAERLKRMGMTKAAAEIDAGLYNAGEVKRREIKSKKAATAEREAETLAKLARFQAALGSKLGASAAPASREADPEAPAARDGAVGITRFRAEGLYYADEDDEDEGGGWAKHALKFVKTVDSKTFAPTVDDYVVFDPLLEKGKAAFKAKQQRREK
jgi:peptidyl-prolyl cis-trans isomerase SDCCAG10